MAKLRRSPFKVNKIETDPHAFGLRTKETIECLEALYNSQSVLISGPRGIGKTSLANQMQQVLEGDRTLLQRCSIEADFSPTLCLFYACDNSSTLEQMALDLLYILEQECFLLPSVDAKEIKPSLEFNLGVVKARLESVGTSSKRSPATVATQLVSGIETVLKLWSKIRRTRNLNILLDELDQLPDEVNFAHFLKIVHETLSSKQLNHVTFILAGQQGIYSRLLEEDPSIERILRHIPISTLDGSASDHVLEYAASKAEPSFRIAPRAKGLILSLSAGYPYVLHLLGNAAFYHMETDQRMSHRAVLEGLESVLKSDKREKYLHQLQALNRNERRIILALSEYSSDSIPVEIPYSWLLSRVNPYFNSDTDVNRIVERLVEKGYITRRKDEEYCRFVEELFRVFVTIMRLEQKEFEMLVADKERRKKLDAREEEELSRIVQSEDMETEALISLIRHEHFMARERRRIIDAIRETVSRARYTTVWEEDDLLEIYRELQDEEEDILELYDELIVDEDDVDFVSFDDPDFLSDYE